MDKQEDFTRTGSLIHPQSYFPTPLRGWFIQLAQRVQLQEKHTSSSDRKGGDSGK